MHVMDLDHRESNQKSDLFNVEIILKGFEKRMEFLCEEKLWFVSKYFKTSPDEV